MSRFAVVDDLPSLGSAAAKRIAFTSPSSDERCTLARSVLNCSATGEWGFIFVIKCLAVVFLDGLFLRATIIPPFHSCTGHRYGMSPDNLTFINMSDDP